MSNSIFSVDEEEQKRQAEHKLRPRPIDINQKLEILVHTLEEVAEEKNAIFFSDLTTVQYSDEPEPLKNAAVPIPRITVLKDDGVSKKLKPFTRPKNYIEYKARPDAEVAKSTEYEVDDEDDEFIEALNDRPTKKKETSNLNVDKFESIIDFFEKEVYYKKKLFFIDDNPSINLDPNDIPCAVCASSKTNNDNPILVCQGCRVAVHQKCCGLKKVSKEDWKCERCSQEKKKISCELCPVTDGVFYPKGELWMHLACVFSFNEIPIQVLPNGYAIKSLEKLPPGSRTSVCYLCDVRKGACIKCLDEDCDHYFHVTCALRRGLNVISNEEMKPRHKSKSKNHGEPAPVLQSYCVKHSINTRMLTKNRKHLFVHKEFKQEEIDELVRLGNSSSRKLNLDKDTMEICYRNWMSRRMFVGKPLITRLQEVVKEEKDVRRRSSKLIVDEEKYKQLKKIRQSLERTRLLIDLSRKRELAKKNLINHYKDIYEFLVKKQTGKDIKKSSPKKPAPAPMKKPVFVKIKKEPGVVHKDDDEMSIEENKSSSKPSPKKKINGHAHNKAIAPVTKTANGHSVRPAPPSKKEANGKAPANKKSSPATTKSEPNGTSKSKKTPTKANNNKKKQPVVIEVKSQSSSEASESEQSSEQESESERSSDSSKEDESEKEESSADEDSSEKSDKSEGESESSNEESSRSEEKSGASESSKSSRSSDNSRESSAEESRSGSSSSSESDDEKDKKPAAKPIIKKKVVAKPIANKNKKETTKGTQSKKPNNRGDRHTKPPPPTRNRPVPVLGTPTRKRAPPGQSSSSKKRKRDSTSFTSNKKQKLRR
jgi:hypothetical protein